MSFSTLQYIPAVKYCIVMHFLLLYERCYQSSVKNDKKSQKCLSSVETITWLKKVYRTNAHLYCCSKSKKTYTSNSKKHFCVCNCTNLPQKALSLFLISFKLTRQYGILSYIQENITKSWPGIFKLLIFFYYYFFFI